MKTKLLLIALISMAATFFACNPEDPDPCDSTAASQKVVNMKATVTIESLAGVPVANQYVQFTIKLLRCSQEETLYDFSDSTDADGQITSNLCNFVLNNTEDRIVMYAVAPNLSDFVTQNFHQVIKKYNELEGVGMENFDLLIQTH